MRRLIVIAVVAVTVSLLNLWGAAALNVPMKLNPSFGVNGVVLVDIAGDYHEDEPFDLVIQPDGKIVTSGKAFNQATGNFDFALLRYNPDGGLDTSFDSDGIVLLDFLGGHDEGLAVALQPDGKIVVSGVAEDPDTASSDFALARFNTDGSVDSSFGVDGRVLTDFTGGSDQSLDVAIQPDGKIVAVGFATGTTTEFDFALARYNPDGTLDNTFGWGGRVMLDIDGGIDGIFGIAIEPDGQIVVSGMAFSTLTNSYDFALARFNSNGSLDTGYATFGKPGVVTTDFMGGTDVPFALLALPDGKMLAGGLAVSTITGHFDFALARYNEDGTLDTTFATYGKPGVVTADFFGDYDQILALALQPDGKIIAAGHAFSAARHFDFGLARFNADGSRDMTFGYGGLFAVDFFGGPDGLHGVAVRPDGTIVATGDAENPFSGGDDFATISILAVDASWIAAVVSDLPGSSFTGGVTDRTSFLDLLDLADQDLTANDLAGAVTKLQELRGHVDGCPNTADANDWISNCVDQQKVRVLVDQMISKLGG